MTKRSWLYGLTLAALAVPAIFLSRKDQPPRRLHVTALLVPEAYRDIARDPEERKAFLDYVDLRAYFERKGLQNTWFVAVLDGSVHVIIPYEQPEAFGDFRAMLYTVAGHPFLDLRVDMSRAQVTVMPGAESPTDIIPNSTSSSKQND
ncbi:MAG: hypothetical protein U0790_27465 [Isosphaeraceae bacterium]